MGNKNTLRFSHGLFISHPPNQRTVNPDLLLFRMELRFAMFYNIWQHKYKENLGFFYEIPTSDQALYMFLFSLQAIYTISYRFISYRQLPHFQAYSKNMLGIFYQLGWRFLLEIKIIRFSCACGTRIILSFHYILSIL